MQTCGEFACCFSGHRFVPGGYAVQLRKELALVVGELCEKGYVTFLSGGALGFDLMAAEVVLEMRRTFPGIRLVMALPCKDQHEKWSKADKFRYERIILAADEVVYLTEKYCTGCMHLRNKFLVDNSDVCVAYMTRRNGGTAYTVGYAEEKGRKVINLAQKL